VTSPQATHLQVSQTPVQTVAPGQQIAVRSVAPVRPATGIKAVVTATDRPMQGVFLKIYTIFATLSLGIPWDPTSHLYFSL